MEHLFFQYNESEISYYKYGYGDRIVICFHGYGEDGSGFSFLEKLAGDKFSFYALDLPYHGKTQWNDKKEIDHKILWDIIIKITNKDILNPVPRITLFGFSLGGRIALSLYELLPEKVEKIVLLAPDGLKMNFWYWMATQTRTGNRFFGYTMKHPEWFFALLEGLNRLKLVNTSIFKFVNYYIGDKKVREDLYKRWTSLRMLKPDLNKIKSCIKKNQTRVNLIYGKHDRIILATRGEKFKKGIEKYCDLRVISSGHQVLHEKHAEEIVEALLV